ncbi:MAG: mechanosensitive ion channel [Candidatus Lokiarchaeota archaeon]|nr:mechanosensitive ion channel [Candidatus Lokiarchaeota archaeon]MBD3198633.1 mechanosensitive ion channel [Candidatus Lokiarchaeota archaeon]
MALFATDLMAFIVIAVLTIILYGLNKLFTYLLRSSKRLTVEQKNKASFIFKLISVVLIVYLVIDGFPSFATIDPEIRAILTGSISTALAFASSEIFANILSGFLLFIIDPFDLGHVVKIKGTKGIVKSINFTKIVIETFNNIMVEITNNDVVSNKVTNYTVDLENIETFEEFRDKIQSPQDKGKARIDFDLNDELIDYKEEMEEIYDTFKNNEYEIIHSYTFRMRFEYDKFRIKIDKISKMCDEFRKYFGFKPRFHIVWFGNRIAVKFRILTFKTRKLMEFQPKFAHEIYKISMGEEDV